MIHEYTRRARAWSLTAYAFNNAVFVGLVVFAWIFGVIRGDWVACAIFVTVMGLNRLSQRLTMRTDKQRQMLFDHHIAAMDRELAAMPEPPLSVARELFVKMDTLLQDEAVSGKYNPGQVAQLDQLRCEMRARVESCDAAMRGDINDDDDNRNW